MDTALKRLPFGSEFSPSVIDLNVVLEICKNNEGNNKAIEAAFLETYFKDKGNGNEKNRTTIAYNCRCSLFNYGILDTNGYLTEIGNKLFSIKDDHTLLYKVLANHILLDLNGLAFVQCLREMHLARETVNLTTLKPALELRGITYPSGGKHPSIMRLWLDKAGVVNKKWEVDEEALAEVLGTKDKTDALSELNGLQKAFLKALVNTGMYYEFQSTSNVVKLAEAVYGVHFPEKSLPKLVLNKLQECGFIEMVKTTGGRGAKPFNVRLNKDINPSVIIPTLEQLTTLEPKLRELIRTPFAEIIERLDSDDTYIKGLALEAFAFKLMRLLDMDYVMTRLRGENTGGAEVDLVFDSARLVYSRWQIQCKNTKSVSLDPVAKEVGLTRFLHSNAIVVVTTGEFSQDARRYSEEIMRTDNLCIILVDKKDVSSICNEPSSVVDVFNREAKHAMQIKKIV